MKLVKALGHPFIVILFFLLLLISGENAWGFYITYLYRAVPHLTAYALLALFGIVFTFLASIKKFHVVLSAAFNIAGILFMIASVYLFFASDPSDYNIGTFQQVVPLISFGLFGLVVFCSLFFCVMKLLSPNRLGQ